MTLVIGYLAGVALDTQTVNVGGVGYLVHTPQPLTPGKVYELHVSTVVRDDSIALYGFASREERTFFAALTRVSGVGPGSALALLGELGPKGIADAVEREDVVALSRVKGIGSKTARALVTLVRVPQEYLGASHGIGGDDKVRDLTSALVGLGIEREAAKQAVSKALADNPDLEESQVLSTALGIAKVGS